MARIEYRLEKSEAALALAENKELLTTYGKALFGLLVDNMNKDHVVVAADFIRDWNARYGTIRRFEVVGQLKHSFHHFNSTGKGSGFPVKIMLSGQKAAPLSNKIVFLLKR